MRKASHEERILCDPATLGVIAAVGTGVSVANTLGVFGGSKSSAMPPPPPPAPLAPPTLNSPDVSRAADVMKSRAKAAGGFMDNIATSPQGIPGGASTTGKTLLGM